MVESASESHSEVISQSESCLKLFLQCNYWVGGLVLAKS